MARSKIMEVDKTIQDQLLAYATNASEQKRLESRARKLKKVNEEIFNVVASRLKLNVMVAVKDYVFKLTKGGNESIAYKDVVTAILEDLAKSGNTKLQKKYEKLIEEQTTPAGSKTILTYVEIGSIKGV